jgi:hypothetical protein
MEGSFKVIITGPWCVVTAGLWRSQTTESTSENDRGKGSGRAREVCRMVALSIARKGCEKAGKGTSGLLLEGQGYKVRVAWNFERMSCPKSGVGQLGRIKKE